MAWEAAGGAAPLPGRGRLFSPCGGGGCWEAAAPYADVGDLKCLPEIAAHVGRGGDVRFPGWGAQREPLSPAPPPPSWGRQPQPSPNPARKSARQRKSTRRKMARGRRKRKGKKPNNQTQTTKPKPTLARRGLREGRSRLVRAGPAGSLAAAPAAGRAGPAAAGGPAGAGGRGGARPEEGPGGEERGGAAAAASRGARPRLPSPLPANSPERFQGTCRAAPRLASGRGRGRRAAIPPGGGGGGGGGLPRCELSALARSWPPARGKRLSLAQSRSLRGGEPPRNAGDAGEGSGRAAKQVAGGCLRALGCLGRCLPDEQEQHLRRLERQRAGRHMVRFQHYSPQGSGASPPSYI